MPYFQDSPKKSSPKLPSSVPGKTAQASLSPAQNLLARHIPWLPQQRTLFIHTGPELLSTGSASQISIHQSTWLDRSHSAQLLVQEQLASKAEVQFTVLFDIDLPQASHGSFDQAALLIPKSRPLARRWLLAAYLALKPGGYLYLAGPNDLGIRPIIKDAETIFSTSTILAYKKGNRIARLLKPLDGPAYPGGVDWVSEPGIAPGTWQEFQFEWRGTSWKFYSLPGVFSSDQLDDGTRLLLDQLQISADARVLDFGCGCGVIGIIAARQGAATVDMVDVDLLAIASARKNVAAYQLSNVRCLAGDGLSPVADQRYTHILSNPPFHSGRSVNYRVTDEFIAGSGRLLEKGGQLTLVANRFIPYEKTLERYYRKITRLAETSRFQVLSAGSPKKSPKS
jgi:16S rRNA (guanine1207-N2)-methyltransferase